MDQESCASVISENQLNSINSKFVKLLLEKELIKNKFRSTLHGNLRRVINSNILTVDLINCDFNKREGEKNMLSGPKELLNGVFCPRNTLSPRFSSSTKSLDGLNDFSLCVSQSKNLIELDGLTPSFTDSNFFKFKLVDDSLMCKSLDIVHSNFDPSISNFAESDKGSGPNQLLLCPKLHLDQAQSLDRSSKGFGNVCMISDMTPFILLLGILDLFQIDPRAKYVQRLRSSHNYVKQVEDLNEKLNELQTQVDWMVNSKETLEKEFREKLNAVHDECKRELVKIKEENADLREKVSLIREEFVPMEKYEQLMKSCEELTSNLVISVKELQTQGQSLSSELDIVRASKEKELEAYQSKWEKETKIRLESLRKEILQSEKKTVDQKIQTTISVDEFELSGKSAVSIENSQEDSMVEDLIKFEQEPLYSLDIQSNLSENHRNGQKEYTNQIRKSRKSNIILKLTNEEENQAKSENVATNFFRLMGPNDNNLDSSINKRDDLFSSSDHKGIDTTKVNVSKNYQITFISNGMIVSPKEVNELVKKNYKQEIDDDDEIKYKCIHEHKCESAFSSRFAILSHLFSSFFNIQCLKCNGKYNRFGLYLNHLRRKSCHKR